MADNMNVTVRDPLAPRRQMPPIVIGRAGEYGATTVTFDLRGFIDRYGAGVPTLLHKRPPDDEAYIVPPSAADTETHDRTEMPDPETLVWHVGQVATSYVGNGKIELQWHPEGAAKKSAQFDVVVLGTIGNPVSEIPSAQQIYLDVMQGIADDAEDAADRAEAAVSHYPQIRNSYWWEWDSELGDWKNTYEKAQGAKGDTGDSVVDATYDAQTGTLTLIPGTPGARSYVTPEMFGAKGDGVTDDTVAVRRAMQEPCVFLKGTYKVTSPISALANVVGGNGKAKILSSGGNCLTFANSVYLSDFAVDTPIQTDGVAIKPQKDIFAERLTITGGRIGILSEGSYYKNIIKSCTFKDLWGDSAAAVHVLFAGITEFSNNYVENVSNDLDRDADGVRFWQGEGTTSAVVSVHGNEFHNCKGRFIKASTNNSDIYDNYCHNDSDFETITYFSGIDVQRGNSKVSYNTVVSPAQAINISIRVDDNTTHVVEFNSVYTNGVSTGQTPAIAITDFGNGTAKTDVTIRGNYTEWENKVNYYIPYIANSVIRLFDNQIIGRNYDGISLRGTFDSSCRFEMIGNKVDNYAYFARFTGGMPNVKGDTTVYAATPLALSAVLTNTSFIANTKENENFGNTAFLETKGTDGSYHITLTDNSHSGAFKKDGSTIYMFPQS